MSDDDNDSFWPPQTVGYKNPPKSHQFRKGKSGNPHGRPPKKKPDPKLLVDKSGMESALRAGSQLMNVSIGETLTELTAYDVVLQKMLAAAVKNNIPAQKAFLERVDRARKDKTTEVENDHSYWREYAVSYNKYAEALIKTGEPLPEHLVHPDDLVFEEGRYVMVRGGDPIIAAQNRDFIIRFRDLFILQSVYDRRYYPFEKHERNTAIFISDILYTHANSCLPKRMQLSESQIVFRLFKHEALPKRILEQHLKRGWVDLGIPHQLVKVTPRIEDSSQFSAQLQMAISQATP